MGSYNYIVPPLNQRELRISKDKPSLLFNYFTPRKCGVFKLLTCWDHHVDEYDLTDPKIRQNLIDIGFIAKVRDGL